LDFYKKTTEVSEIVEDIDPLDYGVDTQHNKTYRTKTKTEIDDLEYFILNVNHTTQLKNGFRFSPELLIQYHNVKLYSDYNELVDIGSKKYSVKSDAFTKSNYDVEKLKRYSIFIMILVVGDLQKRRILFSHRQSLN